MKLEIKNKIWLMNFVKQHKRKLRILHMSNIANNAYNNAKILTECGIENHVISNDAFYAMGCPEWEDAYFIDEIQDIWRPDWSSYNLNHFCRPHWFAQGHLNTCVNYLIALSERRLDDANALFFELAQQNKSVFFPVENKQFPREIEAGRVESAVYSIMKMLWVVARFSWKFMRWLSIKIDSRLLQRNLIKLRNFWHPMLVPSLHTDTDNHVEAIPMDGKWRIDDVLSDEFKKEFPDRLDQLSEQDFYAYYSARLDMQKLLNHYDIVLSYAIEGIYPLMLNKPYFAFEHGTIRDIPYEQNTQGRICALTYRKASHVFVTNSDCLASANYLSPGRFTMINHPYDEDQVLTIPDDWQQQRNMLVHELEADMILFHPTRHDWIEGTGYADKANDVFLNGFISLRQKGLRLGLVCCEWGKNIDESKKLLQDQGVSAYVQWVKPLSVIAYIRMCKVANMVIDQFKLGAFGGVTFKALAAGSPVMSYINVEQILARYPEAPPIINCQTESEIAERLSYWYVRQKELVKLGMSGRKWMKKFHNKADTVNAQIRQFRLHFPGRSFAST